MSRESRHEITKLTNQYVYRKVSERNEMGLYCWVERLTSETILLINEHCIMLKNLMVEALSLV